MGVPAMFRWLSQRYPKIISAVQEERPKQVGDESIPVDRSGPNPNGEEFDNLYLDMNGIIHPCTHPEDGPAPETETDMMMAVFKYTDRLVGMVRPRKLLYLAVDGVAPRAKMNQQRARRFRAAQEAEEKDKEREEFLKILNAQKVSRGEDIATLDEVVKKTWDSNQITPGTPFMHLLAESLQFWCAYKFTTDPSWKDMKVIISDASVPGEGEHKIMNFVRSQRALPTHDPNTSHVICGLDADLIMLSLATHEPHFRILREDVFDQASKGNKCHRCGRQGHIQANCSFPDKGSVPAEEKPEEDRVPGEHLKPHIWLHTNILREYLLVEMDTPKRKFKYDAERSLDDWVFMCFFVGNDFLPHLPSLSIRDQGIELLVSIWRDLVAEMDDYVTLDGFPDTRRVQQIMSALAKKEAGIFKEMKKRSDEQAAKQARREAQNNANKRPRKDDNGNSAPPFKRHKEDTDTYTNAGIVFFDPKDAQSKEVRAVHKDMLHQRDTQSNKSAAAKLKELMKSKADGISDPSAESVPESEPEASTDTPVELGKRKADALEDADDGTPGRTTPVVPQSPSQSSSKPADGPAPDTIRLWEEGYEERYYEQKFHVDPNDIAFRNKVARQYAEGLCWVLAYYMQGCPSWTWYFPHHYAPFAADFVDIDQMNPRQIFPTKGIPFRAYEQLMGVLPAASNHAIPKPYHTLMTDPNSPIIDFYPKDFPLDLNGKKFLWQAIVLLPFIDETRLLKAMATKYDELSDDEKKRNEVGKETLMFSQESGMFEDVEKALYRKAQKKYKLDPATSRALHGDVEPHDLFVLDSQLMPPFEIDENTEFEIIQDGSMRVYYEMPVVSSNRAHKSVLLEGVNLPKPALYPGEAEEARKRSERNGRGGGGGYRGRGGGRGGFNDRRNGGNDFQNGGGRGGHNNNRGGGGGYNGGYNNNQSGYGGPSNLPPPPFHAAFPPPPGGVNGNFPPPPPGWVPPPPHGGWQGANAGYGAPPGIPPPNQRPGWMGNSHQGQHGGPPPRQPPSNNSLQNERFYRPADEILGRSSGGGGGGGRGGYQGNNAYNDRPPRDDRNGRGGRGGRDGGRGGGGGGRNNGGGGRPSYSSNDYR